jgi:hypothetical protein
VAIVTQRIGKDLYSTMTNSRSQAPAAGERIQAMNTKVPYFIRNFQLPGFYKKLTVRKFCHDEF